MPTIIVINGLKLCIYGDDHAPPHFHIFGPDGHFQVDLRSFRYWKVDDFPKVTGPSWIGRERTNMTCSRDGPN